MRTSGLLLALALALAGSPAFSQPDTSISFDKGNDLLRLCESGDTLDRGLCLGIVLGLTNGSQITAPRVQRLRFCEPEGVLLGQRRDVVLKYIREHPERRHFSIAALFYEALAEVFPCPVPKARGR